jgi:hypothetical protein
VIATLALSGCGPGGPAPSSVPSAVTTADRTHEYRTAAGVAPHSAVAVAGDEQAAERVVRSFALAYINWSAADVVSDLDALAARSTGQARSLMQIAAARAAGDYELQRAGIANTGAVESIAPLRASRSTYVVVTRERTIATDSTAYQGLEPAWHVALATVAPVAGRGLEVSGWQPES